MLPGELAVISIGNKAKGIRSRLAFGMALALGTIGCSGGEGHPPTYPVKGRVEVGGEPAAGAFVVFHRAGGDAQAKAGEGADALERPTAQVKADGSFVVTTYEEADGAPAGDYSVTVEWRKLIKKGTEALAGPNVVPKNYGSADTTPLKVTVKPGENDEAVFQIDTRKR